jgi:hypothetical protein
MAEFKIRKNKIITIVKRVIGITLLIGLNGVLALGIYGLLDKLFTIPFEIEEPREAAGIVIVIPIILFLILYGVAVLIIDTIVIFKNKKVRRVIIITIIALIPVMLLNGLVYFELLCINMNNSAYLYGWIESPFIGHVILPYSYWGLVLVINIIALIAVCSVICVLTTTRIVKKQIEREYSISKK